MSVDRAQIEHLRSFVATPRCMSYETIRSLDDILDNLEAASSEVADLRRQLEERKSPDMVTVPREEWEVLNTISAFWCPPFGVPQNTATEALFAKLDALRSGEAENKGGA